jgi:hypothetical protein
VSGPNAGAFSRGPALGLVTAPDFNSESADSSAATSASAVGNRFAGSFSKQRSTITSTLAGTCNRFRLGGSGCTVKCCAMKSYGVLAGNGLEPVSISYNTTPSA